MSNAISDLCPVHEYQRARNHIFRSPWAIDWFVRQHKGALVESGALLMIIGAWHANPPVFDQFVLGVGQRQASARVAEAV